MPPGPADSPVAEPSRFAQWRSSWSVALRMARRDVRRHKGRSALVVVMVLLPTLLLSAVVTIAYTSDVKGAEKIPMTMGSGQALLEGPDASAAVQGPDPYQAFGYVSDDGEGEVPPATPVPGYDPGGDPFENAGAVARLVGADVAALDEYGLRTTVDDRRVSLQGLALDGRTGLEGKVDLLSGRWPATPPSDPAATVEVLLTPYALSKGVPGSGTFTGTVDGTTRTFEVVGTAGARLDYSQAGVVTAGEPVARDAGSGGIGRWIVLGDDPVTWDEVRELNGYGFRVTSRAVLEDPPSVDRLDPDIAGQLAGDDRYTSLLVGLGAAMLLVVTTLLVGPAFAVSAARQRRTLALAASNGAHTPMLRRTVLGQALVLGALSAVAGTVLGVGAAWAVVAWTRTTDDLTLTGPFDVRPLVLGAVALAAVASTVIAALVPARRLGRLDIVGVMRGQSVSPRPSRLVLAAGLLLAVVGAVLTLAGTGVLDSSALGPLRGFVGYSSEYLVTIGAVVLILGSLLLVPMLLTAVGRLGSHLPTSLRMSARDLARHRARSAPSVAAVLAAVAGLTFGLTGLSSDTEQNRREYVPSTLPGEAVLYAFGPEAVDDSALEAAAPGLVVDPVTILSGDPSNYAYDSAPQEPYRVQFLSLVPDGCSVQQTLGGVAVEGQFVEECLVAGTQANGSGMVLALPADQLLRRLDLSDADAARVRAGAVVVLGGRGSTAEVASGSYRVDPTAEQPVAPDLKVERDETVPALALPRTKENSGRLLGATLAFAADSPAVAGLDTRAGSWTVRMEDGSPVPDAALERIQQALGDEGNIQREDGFQRDDRLVVGILLGVFSLLILVVTLTSTALTLAEQQTDQATLAALGATRGTRRVMAAAQAFVLAAVGCVLGVAVGLVPGIAISKPLTTNGYDPLTFRSVDTPGVLVIPWLALLTVGVLVPVVAAALAAAGIRRAPQVTRRAT
ncbi:ABC transporter permease [Phycicoccus sonneratiae]|uniref:ABC transporter permease n=1 Tax=Phycicoccus sonneratiae TaxID=2807628 RepID=UPI001951A21F|nr:FtsX-like permease family protein [Phycicoccus sonneraticus]